MSVKIKLKNRDDEYVIIDQKCYDDILANDYLMSLKFLDNIRAHSHGYGVYQRCISTKHGPVYETIYLHKYIGEKYCPKPEAGDAKLFIRFINGDSHDVRVENLEWTTMQKLRRQMSNTSSKTGYRGVVEEKKGFRALIYHNKVVISLGTFATPEEAAEAYNKKSIELYGVTASLNEIPQSKDK